MGAQRSISVAVVEDQELFRRMLVALCRGQFGYDVVAEAGTVAEALAIIPKAKPDVLLLDLQLPDGDGLDLARTLLETQPELRIVALTSRQDEVTVHRVRELGLPGFVDKNTQDPKTLATAIEAVAAGRSFHTEVVQQVHRNLRGDPQAFTKVLSEREQELLGLLGRGWSNEEAAAQLSLSAWTVHSHRRNIMKKLGLTTQAELMRYAVRKGFVRSDSSGF